MMSGEGLLRGPLIHAPLEFRIRSGGAPAKDSAFITCPKCEAPCFIRRSERITETVKHLHAHCTNTGCGHTFLSQVKALLPPPGGGQRYSGVKVAREQRAAVEALYLEGLGVLKIAARTGISKTTCTRIRTRLVKRLKRKGQCLPGCDSNGKRHAQAHSFRHIHPAQKKALRTLLLNGTPVLRAAHMAAVGTCSAYAIRDELVAELATQGETLIPPFLPGRVRKGAFTDQNWPPQGAHEIYAFRAMLGDLSFEDAKAKWRADRASTRRAEAARPKSFEEQLALVAAGKGLAPTLARDHLQPRFAEDLRGAFHG